VNIFILIVAFIGLTAVVASFVFIARNPLWAAYIFLATQPFIGGIDRGKIIPLLRPSEALQFFLTGAVLAGVAVRALQGERLSVRLTRLDRAIVLLAVLSSIWPLCWMFARGRIPSSTDFFSTIVIWRLAGLYALFRWVVKTPEQVRKCMWILLVSAGMLAILAIADSLGIFKLGGIWAPAQSDGSNTGRGAATLNSSIAVGDYLSYAFAVALVYLLRGRQPKLIVGAVCGLCVLGILGTGQFSAWIAALIVVVVVARQEGQMARLAAWMVPLGVLAAVVAGPVVAQRLAGFSGPQGLPPSWLGRYDNLHSFFLPMLGNFRWVLGVRPDSVIPAPETWRDVIYLESGYLWFFWVGGIPLFLGFLWFARAAFRQTRVVIDRRHDDISVAAVATRAALWCLMILSIIDMHLTLRGGGDLFFILLGLTANLNVPEPIPDPEPPPRARALGGVVTPPRALMAGAAPREAS
jgi:hypothetical protein